MTGSYRQSDTLTPQDVNFKPGTWVRARTTTAIINLPAQSRVVKRLSEKNVQDSRWSLHRNLGIKPIASQELEGAEQCKLLRILRWRLTSHQNAPAFLADNQSPDAIVSRLTDPRLDLLDER
jgi:hypothetical protein